MKHLEVLLPTPPFPALDGMTLHCRMTPRLEIGWGTVPFLYQGEERLQKVMQVLKLDQQKLRSWS